MNGVKPVPAPPPEAESPTSLAEVSIRTMASDIDSIMRSGGGAPRPIVETIAIAEQRAGSGKRTMLLLWLLVAVVGAGALFFAGYSLLPLVFPKPQSSAPSVAPAGALPTSTAAQPLFLGHRTFFRVPADEVIMMKTGAVSGAANLQSYSQQLKSLLQDVRASSTFVELAFQKADNQAIGAAEFFFLADANILDSKTVNDRFERDFTAFIHRDKAGFHPGYVFKLKGGTAALHPDVSSVEAATSSLANLFIDPPGNALTFRDTQVSGQPFRALSYNSKATLFYGWVFGNYLVFGTSEEGLKAAITHL